MTTTNPHVPAAIDPRSAVDADFSPVPKATLKFQLVNLIAIVVPFLGVIAAFILLWGMAFNWMYLVIFIVMYLATGLGITVGYHRLFTHCSFKAPRFVVYLLGVCGSMAVQGPLLEWVATHRRHHQHSDDHEDPHSPHHHGDTLWGVLRGAWHAHVGWMFTGRRPGLARYVKDLRKDPMICHIDRRFPLYVVLGLVLPAAVGGLVTMSWTGVLLGFLWGGLVRIFLVHHVTWSVNSICHIWGQRPYRTHDESRNNVIVGVLALGEGWHNNHHAFPTSAAHGLHWWQFDLSYLLIRAMGLLGLARDIRRPTPERLAQKDIGPSKTH